jgi:RimJ/RimL family protein N-acetyltransferase
MANLETRTFTLDDGSALVIRVGVPEDAAAMLAYLECVSGESDFLTFGPGEFEMTEAQEAAHLAAVYKAPDHLHIVAMQADAIVACLTFGTGRRQRVRHHGELAISVRQSHWGRRIGALLMDTLIDWARTTGSIRKISLRVRTDNARGIALYREKGFVVEGTLRREICVDGKYFDLLYMGLLL